MSMVLTLIWGSHHQTIPQVPLFRQPELPQLTSPVCDLQVACGQVLLHVLLEGFLKELLSLLQLQLLGVLHLQDLLRVLGI